MGRGDTVDSMNHRLVELDQQQRVLTYRNELVEIINRFVGKDGTVEPLKGLRLHRVSSPTDLAHGVSELAFCVIGQGSKDVFLGEDRYRYDPMHYLLATAELPIVSHVIEASPEFPYLSLSLKLEPSMVSSVMVSAGHVAVRGHANVRAIDVSRLTVDLLDAVVRLVRLIDTPSEAPFLAGLITREIVYRLLTGEQGHRLCYIAVQAGHTHQIARAIALLRAELDQPLQIDDIAQEVGMSVSSFYHHFKAVTAMSPLQYQKQMRLQEARRLMLAENLDAAGAGYQVGYSDASHFSRDYKQLFGLPPLSDVKRLRRSAMARTSMNMGKNQSTSRSY